MDEEREAATGAISHLMTEAQVPAWVTHDATADQNEQVRTHLHDFAVSSHQLTVCTTLQATLFLQGVGFLKHAG